MVEITADILDIVNDKEERIKFFDKVIRTVNDI